MLAAMKKIFTLVLALTFFIPAVSFAVGLTSQQAASLIGVVQSSPGTPASAFVSLITAFSNITVNQATSLITVVQAAPGVPANAFVNLLTSFTVDTVVTQPTTPAVTSQVTPQPIPVTSIQTQIEITSIKITPSLRSVDLEWATNIPTNAKVFVSGQGVPTRLAQSSSGLSTRHIANVPSLEANTDYVFEIEATSDSLVSKRSGAFKTTSMARIDIIDYMPKSGLNRPHSTSPELDEGGKGNPMNALIIGAVVYDDNGEPTRSAVVSISVKSPTGEETSVVNGTGGVIPIYPDGYKRVVPFYGLQYEFKVAGEHVITFSANGVSQSVAVQVAEAK